MHCKYLPVVPYKALENFSKALYGTTGRYLQCMHYPSCHVSFFSPPPPPTTHSPHCNVALCWCWCCQNGDHLGTLLLLLFFFFFFCGGGRGLKVNSSPVIFFTFNSMNQMQLSHHFLVSV